MRNVFLFIRRYFTFLTFLVLQGVALSMLFRYNRTHRAFFLGKASEITGRVNNQYNKVQDYLAAKEESKRTNKANAELLNRLKENYLVVDSGSRLLQDSVPFDTLGHFKQWVWRDARVVSNSVRLDKNLIQLNRGSAQGVRDNMAVFSSDLHPVGVVVSVSPNFSQVMSLLHVQSRLSASLKKGKELGIIEWNAKDPRYLTLKGLPGSVEVKKGDTVVTNMSSVFPPGYIIGTVAEVGKENASGFYSLKVKTAANFLNLELALVAENLLQEEQLKLEKETKKKLEESKGNK
jgi:rod shape-determining protein MreC